MSRKVTQINGKPLPAGITSMSIEPEVQFIFPLADGDVAHLRVPHPMGEENYRMLIEMLTAAKPALVEPKPPDETRAVSGREGER